jgi:hypothetical protein
MKRLIALAAVCLLADPSLATKVYTDITGQNRGNEAFLPDSGACQMYAQQVVQSQPLPPNNSCRNCGLFNAMTIVGVRQNAYEECLLARGWQAR